VWVSEFGYKTVLAIDLARLLLLTVTVYFLHIFISKIKAKELIKTEQMAIKLPKPLVSFYSSCIIKYTTKRSEESLDFISDR